MLKFKIQIIFISFFSQFILDKKILGKHLKNTEIRN